VKYDGLIKRKDRGIREKGGKEIKIPKRENTEE
jgi:hypothetical protein